MGSERSVSPGRLAVALLGFAALAFGVGAGVESAELGRGTAVAGAVVLALVFLLVLLGGHVAAPAVPADRPDRPSAPDRAREAYVLGVCGAAALALVLGGLLFLVLPGDLTALAVLLVGVLACTTVVMASFRLRSRRDYPGPSAERSWAMDRTYQRRVRAARSRAPDSQ